MEHIVAEVSISIEISCAGMEEGIKYPMEEVEAVLIVPVVDITVL